MDTFLKMENPSGYLWAKNTLANVLIFTAGYLVIFGTQYLYEDSWFDWSVNEIPNVQADVYGTWKWNAWTFYTNMGGGTLQAVYMLVYVIFFNSDTDAVLLTLNMAVEMFFMTLLKIFHY